MALFAPSFRFLAAAASAAGSPAVPVARPSSRSFSGWVCVCSFLSPAAARAFAVFAAGVVGRSVVVRGLSVSVPCAAVRGVSLC